MREILFRGKRTDNREWAEGYIVPLGKKSFSDPDRYGIINKAIPVMSSDVVFNLKIMEVDPSTICQYTGLTDKNGRKIFEGDICKDGRNIVRILWNDKHQWGVENSKTDNVLSRGLIFPLWQYDNCKENGNRQLEVIGNIFDNSELLEREPDENE